MKNKGKMKFWGISTAINLYECNDKKVRSAKSIRQFVKKLLTIIDMKAFGKTIVVNFGEEERIKGFSMVQLIETSLVSGHFVNQTNAVYLDIFSCKAYEPEKAVKLAKTHFEAKSYTFEVIIRK